MTEEDGVSKLIDRLYDLNLLVISIGNDVRYVLKVVGLLLLLNLGANSGQVAVELLKKDVPTTTIERLPPAKQYPEQ